MYRKLAALLIGVLVSSTSIGCSVSARTAGPSYIAERHLLFNPEWMDLPVGYVARSDWPSTVAFSTISEAVEYRETIIDWQGRFGADSDRLYRRFGSVRTGRALR